MSDFLKCDVCGKMGRRRYLRHCPDGWLYGETLVDDLESAEGEIIITAVCSTECRDAFWHKGPGDLRTGMQNTKTRAAFPEAFDPALEPFTPSQVE